jgi:RHH-type proline utilization regulon transcriptional repressor/proline dehydrogenase/delta 1-pyrroline-5-carboxylate dehydrogenase
MTAALPATALATAPTPSPAPLWTDRLGPPVRDEAAHARALVTRLAAAMDWPAVIARATPWVEAVRATPAPFWALESLLREYPISSAEGLALMRLAEALLRVPDTETAIALAADQLGRAGFDGAAGGEHHWLADLSAQAIGLSKKFLPEEGGQAGLWQRLGARTVVAATVRAIQLLGRQFVLGTDIGAALDEARAQRRAEPAGREPLVFSFDMLGEGARNDDDARRYLAAYAHAIEVIAQRQPAGAPERGDGISIKLSALHARYEITHLARLREELLPRVLGLLDAAARAGLNLTIDAEETERLELSLILLDELAAHAARHWPQWGGLGLAVQAYQLRALETVDAVAAIARRHGIRFMVRLVKGAYWDAEVKRAQELGLDGYPVFTHKHHTDLSYLACADALLHHRGVIYPQFATHNAGTIAAIVARAAALGAPFELQRLHGMGEGVYREVRAAHPEVPLRVYAPVGEHRDLLAYLVRRLLENGANSSFVHQLADPSVDPVSLLASPLHAAPAPGQPLPRDLYREAGDEAGGVPGRVNARGLDLAIGAVQQRLAAAHAAETARAATAAPLPDATVDEARAAMAALDAAWPHWNATALADRCAVIRRAGDLLDQRLEDFCARLVREGRKTWPDAVAEVREAVDFCRYYARQAALRLATQTLPGPTGERNELHLHGRGVFVCISPWNFPLAIFAGQVVAALVAGNTVAAKPAEQTPDVARAFVELLHEAGLPRAALALLTGPGETVGAALVADARCAGVCFTGSTQVAKIIQRTLAQSDGPIVPLIAETGGLNAMLVDSSALPEQVVDAVVQSAFRSAGQRCSALRLLCLHEGIADGVLRMLAGAMQGLHLGEPQRPDTDVGPVIDAEARAMLEGHVRRLDAEARRLAAAPLPAGCEATHVAPVMFEVPSVSALRTEVFGPVLHVMRWGPGTGAPDLETLVAQVNALGYGLTLGVQTRIDRRAERVAATARVGNVYVNRNMVGAVVGVQPFGGEGLSGTGPKAGGPHYLYRFCAEQTVTVNTAAAGGNAALLAGQGGH